MLLFLPEFPEFLYYSEYTILHPFLACSPQKEISLELKQSNVTLGLECWEYLFYLSDFVCTTQAILPVKESVENDLGRVPTDRELAAAMNMNVGQLRKHLEVGRAARNKLIKVMDYSSGLLSS